MYKERILKLVYQLRPVGDHLIVIPYADPKQPNRVYLLQKLRQAHS